MSSVIDLAKLRARPVPAAEILHPAGVRVPFDESAFAEFLIPEVRGDISSGSYSSNVIRHVPDAVHPGDRALVIGAGLGVVSTLIAKTARADRVLAVEADPRLIPCLKRVHARNGAGWVETVLGVPSTRGTGLTRFYPNRDFRNSSVLPNSSANLPVLVPCLDLNLILADEQINLIVCNLPGAPMLLFANAELDRVERIMIDCTTTNNVATDNSEIVALLVERGFSARSSDNVLMFERAGSMLREPVEARYCADRASGF